MSRVGVSRVLVAVLLLVLSACQIDVDVALDVAADGSGVVSVQTQLDYAAQQTIGDVATQLRLGDLERSGWTVTTVEDDDGVRIEATKAVADASRWQGVLDEIAGPGVFNDVDLVIEDNQHVVSFDLDLRQGWGLLSDDAVTEALGGEPFGAPLETLTNGRSIDDIISLDLDVSVRNFDDGETTVRSFSPRFDQQSEQIRVQAVSENSTAVLIRWIAYALFSLFALAAVLAITGIVLQRRADRLRPAPTPAPLASRVPGTAGLLETPARVAAATGVMAAPAKATVRLVVVEALSVFYAQQHVFDQHLLPFVREHGGTARADTIAEGFSSVLAGSMDTPAFWELCGVTESATELDARYIAGRRLHSGAAGFLAEMQKRRIPVAATTNDAATWSAGVRERDRLSAVWPWLVSSTVGTTTSNSAMFEVLRRESGVAYGHCLYVDTSIENLDTAKELGMKTALFDTGDIELPAVVGHPVVTEFASLLGKN